MATTRRPAVIDPREFTLREVQPIIAAIRARLNALDAAVGSLETTQSVRTTAAATDLTAIRRDIVNLQAAIAALQAQIDSLEGGGEVDGRVEQIVGELQAISNALEFPPSDPRVEQLAGELSVLQQLVDAPDPIPARLPAVEAALGELQQQVAGIDEVGQTAAHAALLQGLQGQIDDINRGYLV